MTTQAENDYKYYLRRHEYEAHMGLVSPWHQPMSFLEWFNQQSRFYQAYWGLGEGIDSALDDDYDS